MANTNSNGASLKNILKVPDIQKRLLFTFLILVGCSGTNSWRKPGCLCFMVCQPVKWSNGSF